MWSREVAGFQWIGRRAHAFVNRATSSRIAGPFASTTSSASFGFRLYSSSEPELAFFASQNTTFESLGLESKTLLKRIRTQLDFDHPSAVQAAAFEPVKSGQSVTIGAETGSGKTLSYLIPLMDDILTRKANASDSLPTYDFCRAVILVPNKELVNQVVRMAVDLCGGREVALVDNAGRAMSRKIQQQNATDNTDSKRRFPKDTVYLAVMPGGLKQPTDFAPFRHSIGLGGQFPPCDLVVTTPAALGPFGLKPVNIDLFADVETLVLDEADMLLDGGYIKSLDQVLMGFRRADKLDAVNKTQYLFVAATLPDFGTRSVDAYIKKKFPDMNRVVLSGMHNARHYGLKERTLWIEEETNKARLEKLIELLRVPPSQDGLQGEKVMVFLNSVSDVDGVHAAMQRAGIEAVPFHAKIRLEERSQNLDRFRTYGTSKQTNSSVSTLLCTDLASRGLDVPGVTAIVQLQFAGNVVAHLHRMGRCGRAGQRNGRVIVFHNAKQRELISVIQQAENDQERMVLEQDVQETEEEEDGVQEASPEEGAAGDGRVNKAFSRRRGFTRKIKKERRRERRREEEAQDIASE